MYNPPTFQEHDQSRIFQHIQEHPLGLLISSGATGLQISPLPFYLAPDEGEHGVLRSHIAKANSH